MRLALPLIALCLVACSSNPSCDLPINFTEHDISAAQRAMIEAGDAGTLTSGCETVCWSFDTPRNGQRVTCTLGMGDGGDTVTCTYQRICR